MVTKGDAPCVAHLPKPKESIMETKPGRSIARPAETPEQQDEVLSRANFAHKYPSLFGLLSKIRENDNFHDRGCITVFWEDGVFKVSINDRPLGRSCFVSSEELSTAFAIADRGLRSGTLKWRKNKGYVAQARRLFK